MAKSAEAAAQGTPLAPSSSGQDATWTPTKTSASSFEYQGSPPTPLVIVCRTPHGHAKAVSLPKPDEWHDFLQMVAHLSGTPVSELQTFQFYQQTGKSRNNDREPIGTASWREVADDSTIMVEVPGPLPIGPLAGFLNRIGPRV